MTYIYTFSKLRQCVFRNVQVHIVILVLFIRYTELLVERSLIDVFSSVLYALVVTVRPSLTKSMNVHHICNDYLSTYPIKSRSFSWSHFAIVPLNANRVFCTVLYLDSYSQGSFNKVKVFTQFLLNYYQESIWRS